MASGTRWHALGGARQAWVGMRGMSVTWRRMRVDLLLVAALSHHIAQRHTAPHCHTRIPHCTARPSRSPPHTPPLPHCHTHTNPLISPPPHTHSVEYNVSYIYHAMHAFFGRWAGGWCRKGVDGCSLLLVFAVCFIFFS